MFQRGRGGHYPEPGSAPAGVSAAIHTYLWVLTSELGARRRVGLGIHARAIPQPNAPLPGTPHVLQLRAPHGTDMG